MAQRYQSYGNYDSNVPMKIFSGQPQYATRAQVGGLAAQVGHLTAEMISIHPEVAKKACHKTLMDLDCKYAADSKLCHELQAACKHHV